MISAALKERGVAAWQTRARQLHDEANRCAFECDLPTSLAWRRKAFQAERNVREWQSYEINQPTVSPVTTAGGHHDPTLDRQNQ
jgi:hypothetical protein